MSTQAAPHTHALEHGYSTGCAALCAAAAAALGAAAAAAAAALLPPLLLLVCVVRVCNDRSSPCQLRHPHLIKQEHIWTEKS